MSPEPSGASRRSMFQADAHWWARGSGARIEDGLWDSQPRWVPARLASDPFLGHDCRCSARSCAPNWGPGKLQPQQRETACQAHQWAVGWGRDQGWGRQGEGSHQVLKCPTGKGVKGVNTRNGWPLRRPRRPLGPVPMDRFGAGPPEEIRKGTRNPEGKKSVKNSFYGHPV